MRGENRTVLGIEHFNAGRFEQAIACFRGVLDPTTRSFLAHALDASGHRKKAVAALNTLIADHPRFLPAHVALASIALRAFKTTPAPALERALRSALAAAESALRDAGAEARPALAKLLHARAASDVAAGRPKAKELALRRAQALAAHAAHIRAKRLAALLALGQAQRGKGRFTQAESTFRRALKLAPRSPAATEELAATLQARGWAVRSEKFLRASLALDPPRREFLRRLDKTLLERQRAFRGVDAVAALQLSAQRHCIAGRLIKRDAALERVLTAARDRPIARFKALMNLGRYRDGLTEAEAILDRGPALADVWSFANPWDWEDWTTRSMRGPQIVRELERTPHPGPWLHFYRGQLGGEHSLDAFDRLSAFPLERYGWMYTMAGRLVLIGGSVPKAVKLLTIATRQKPHDWRTHCFLGEAHLVLQRGREAYEEMDRAALIAPAENEGLLLAWRGAFDLWTGEYARALKGLDRACELGATHAYCWKGGALLKLGRTQEALKTLDLTIKLYPGDIEAYVWRGEARRLLGQYEGAIADSNQSPLGVWALANRSLAKMALGDQEGAAADYAAIPKNVRERAGGSLETALTLARGWRREEYGQSLWLNAA